ncbi:MAG: NAD(P)H-hydrate epimerase [Eubacteriales bacterium]|nr:NAD(P)H-hydrate epimerase [Eubacteriales bacterium]
MKNISDKIDKKYVKVCLYALATVLAGLFFVFICYESAGFWTKLGRVAGAVMKPLITGIIICYLLLPVTNFFDKKFSKGRSGGAVATASRAGAVALTVLIVAGVITVALAAVFVTFYRQIGSIDFVKLQDFLTQLESQYSDMANQLSKFLGDHGFSSENVAKILSSLVSSGTSVLKNLFFGLIFSIYFLYDGKRIGSYWKSAARRLLSPKFITGSKVFLKDADEAFSGYIRGQMVDAFIVGILVSIALMVAGVPYGAMIGIMTGVGNLIPYFGPILGYAMIIVICLVSADFQKMILGLVILALIQVVDANVINPKLLSNSIHIHPLFVIACVLAGGSMGGVLGMLIAVPTGALIKKEFERFMDHRDLNKHPDASHADASAAKPKPDEAPVAAASSFAGADESASVDPASKAPITGKQAKAADIYAINTLGIPSLQLMETASSKVSDYIADRFADDKDKRILILSGVGNNGADGICVGKQLKAKGFQPTVLIIGNMMKATDEFNAQLDAFGDMGGQILWYEEDMELPETDVLVDGIFGIGLSREVGGDYKKLIEAADEAEKEFTVAIDTPSGINTTTGGKMGCAVKADATITFGRNKVGLSQGAGYEYAGQVMVEEIGIPDFVYDKILAGEI